MATFLQVGGVLGYFSVVFAFLLVFVLIYGFLSMIKPFGGKQLGIYAIIALAFSILSIVNGSVLRFIYFITPWFFVLVFIGFIIMFALMMFGWNAETIAEKATTSNFKTYAIVIIVVIIIFGLGSAFGQNTLEQGTNNGTTQATTGGAGGSNTATTNNPADVTVPDPTQLPDISNHGATGTPSRTSTTNYGENVLNTLVNPQVLGLILIMFVGVFAMFFMTKTFID